MSATTILIPSTLKDIRVYLDIISQIKKKHKLNTKSMNFADADSWWDALMRRWNYEDKTTSTEFIERSVEAAIKAISDYPDFSDTIRLYLNNAKNGILTEIEVYCKYPGIVGKLNIILHNIENVNKSDFL